jgi:hypothetical protein
MALMKKITSEREKNCEQYHVIGKKQIKTIPLSEVVERYVPAESRNRFSEH